jgi:hypothetical protein
MNYSAYCEDGEFLPHRGKVYQMLEDILSKVAHLRLHPLANCLQVVALSNRGMLIFRNKGGLDRKAVRLRQKVKRGSTTAVDPWQTV